MGYCAIKIKNKRKVIDLLKQSRYYRLYKNQPNVNEVIWDDRPNLWFEGKLLWTHDSNIEKVLKYLNKKNIY